MANRKLVTHDPLYGASNCVKDCRAGAEAEWEDSFVIELALPSNGQSSGRTGIKANIDIVNETIRYIANKRCIRLIAQQVTKTTFSDRRFRSSANGIGINCSCGYLHTR